MSDNNVRYVVFDLESRDIKGILRNRPGIGETYFESTYEELKDFIDGVKNSANYYVEKDNQQSKYSLKIKKTNIAINLLDDRLYKIPKKHFGEIMVTNFIKDKILRIQIENNFRNYLKSKYKITETTPFDHINFQGAEVLDFVFCYDSDPHNLINYKKIPILQLLMTEYVDIVYEKNYENCCVFTKRIYNDYTYIEKE